MSSRRKLNISVLGSYSASVEEKKIAYELGKGLANLPVNIISGGQKGVMLSLCKGAFENRSKFNENNCNIIGILPYSCCDKANDFVDVVIPSGSAALQNMLVPSAGDIVVAIGGSSGTLAEISFAWQSGKLIALLGSTGWAKKLAFTRLDNRREDPMPHFERVQEVLDLIASELAKRK